MPKFKRRTPQVEPVFDSSKSEADDRKNVGLHDKSLPKVNYNAYIKYVRTASVGEVNTVLVACSGILKRLGLRRTGGVVVERTPRGLNKINIRTLIEWGNKLTRNDKEAITQVRNIIATCLSRR